MSLLAMVFPVMMEMPEVLHSRMIVLQVVNSYLEVTSVQPISESSEVGNHFLIWRTALHNGFIAALEQGLGDPEVDLLDCF